MMEITDFRMRSDANAVYQIFTGGKNSIRKIRLGKGTGFRKDGIFFCFVNGTDQGLYLFLCGKNGQNRRGLQIAIDRKSV